MNRTINFRGKRFDNGQWAYGNLIIDDCGNCEIVDYKNNQEIRYDVRGETIGQFTGLYDDNGKEIYEGDIFQVKAYEPKFEVYFKNGVFEYRQIGSSNRPFPLRRIYFDSYVLGNIHDNPELLKGDKQ